VKLRKVKKKNKLKEYTKVRLTVTQRRNFHLQREELLHGPAISNAKISEKIK